MDIFIEITSPSIIVVYGINLLLVSLCLIIKKNNKLLSDIVKILVALSLVLTSLSFCLLIYNFLLTDLSIINVVQNSHSDLPIIFKIGCAWSNHEGSMVLWIWIQSIILFMFLNTVDRQSLFTYTKISRIAIFTGMYFYVFLIHTSLPNLRTTYTPINGAELSPILQDVLLVIHPPLIYMGYILTIVPFVISIYLMNYSNTQKDLSFWKLIAKKWTIASLIFLTIGITIGSWWAYYELGWGGWWFWDPVENASLMPWISGLVLIHRMKDNKEPDTLTLLMMSIPFYTSLVGTFMVRSGLLESVHSFAQDTHRGTLFVVYIFGLTIYMLNSLIRYNRIQKSCTGSSSILVINISVISLSFILAVIFIGTFYPSIHQLVYSQGVTVGFSFFHNIINPLVVILLFVLCFHICSKIVFSWSKYFYIVSGYFVCIVYTYIYISNSASFIILSCSLYALLMSVSYVILMNKSNLKIIQISDIAHISFIIFIVACCIYVNFKEEFSAILNVGEIIDVHKYKIYAQNYNYGSNDNYTSHIIQYKIDSNFSHINVVPEKRYYFLQNFYSSKPDVLSSCIEDIYTIGGDGDIYNGWEYKIHINVGMSILWLSSLLMLCSFYFNYKSIQYKTSSNKNLF